MRRIRVQMPQGTGSVSVGGKEYTADENGIVRVDHAQDVGPLVGLGGVELGEGDTPAGALSGLMGTTRFPGTIELPGEGREPVELDQVVRETFAKIDVTADEWNNLPQAIRDILIGFRVSEMRGEIGSLAGVSDELADAHATVNRLEGEIDTLQARIQELQDTRPPAGDTGSGDAGQTSSDAPAFADMTKAKINEWLQANGGEPIQSGDHASHVTAAQKRWAELNKKD